MRRSGVTQLKFFGWKRGQTSPKKLWEIIMTPARVSMADPKGNSIAVTYTSQVTLARLLEAPLQFTVFIVLQIEKFR